MLVSQPLLKQSGKRIKAGIAVGIKPAANGSDHNVLRHLGVINTPAIS